MSTVPTMRIPLSAPEVTESDIKMVTDVLRTPFLSLGPRLEQFERGVREYVGASHAVAVNSGTSGLHLCIRVLGIGEGDEVIVPSFAFVAVANAVVYERAVPVFVEVDPETLCMDPEKIEAAVSSRTRAILVVHTFGRPADIHAIRSIATRHHLFLIEDACEAFGAKIEGRRVGAFGDVSVFAFYPNKQLTTGEGGIVVTNNSEIAASVRSLRNQGRREAQDWFQHTEIGYSYRISDILCALGTAQLKRIDSILCRRESIAQSYNCRLGGNPNLILPAMSVPGCRISWFVYVVRLSERLTRDDRDWILRELQQQQIGCGRYFAPIHLQPAYQSVEFRKADLSLTERIAERTIALPFFNQLSDTQVEEVSKALVDLLERVPSQ